VTQEDIQFFRKMGTVGWKWMQQELFAVESKGPLQKFILYRQNFSMLEKLIENCLPPIEAKKTMVAL
jgi:hypothetical protein